MRRAIRETRGAGSGGGLVLSEREWVVQLQQTVESWFEWKYTQMFLGFFLKKKKKQVENLSTLLYLQCLNNRSKRKLVPA